MLLRIRSRELLLPLMLPEIVYLASGIWEVPGLDIAGLTWICCYGLWGMDVLSLHGSWDGAAMDLGSWGHGSMYI